MATLAPNRFFLCRRTAVLRRQDVSPASMNRCERGFARQSLPAKTRRAVCDAKAQGIKNPVMVGAIPFDPVSLRRCIFLNPGSRSPVRKTSFRTPFHPQPVAECGGTPGIPEQTTFEQMVARAAALTATRRSTKWCCHG